MPTYLKPVAGFSKLSKREKILWLAQNLFKNPEEVAAELKSFWHLDEKKQKVFDDFSENTISNYYLPFGVLPNLKINDKIYCVPMVIEESSVVAAASSAAKFWLERGGFKATIVGTEKVGQVHFLWNGHPNKLKTLFPQIKQNMLEGTAYITENMQKRGGGITDIQLVDMTEFDPNYFQIKAQFETCDSMGANFINSVLEELARILTAQITYHPELKGEEKKVNIIMSILSNYTPNCLVRAEVSCPVAELGAVDNLTSQEFAFKFQKAVSIAHWDAHRASTHNKGIFNGIDAVALATGNDFRAIEACGHTYAAKTGKYCSLSHCTIEDGIFRFWLDLPLAIGTVGGLTTLHPLAKRSMEMLGYPNSTELMQIIAATGLAQNFAAVRSLVTTGIQKGHMKMHLLNILNHLEAKEDEVAYSVAYFTDRLVSYTAVRDYLTSLRLSKI